MAGKPDRSAAANVADEVLRDIGEWHEFRDLLSDPAELPSALEARFEREHPAPMPAKLLGRAGGDDAAAAPENRFAVWHGRRAGYVHRAMAAHLAVCKVHACYRWLASRPQFAAAEKSIIAGKADASTRGLEFLRIVSSALVLWAVMRYGTTDFRTADSAALKMRLTKEEMRDAAGLAERLSQVLSRAFSTGSETAEGAYRHSHDLAARGGSHSFKALLAAVAGELRERADTPDRIGPNNDTAADRALAVELAQRLKRAFGDPHMADVHRLCAAFGVTLDRTTIEDAIAKGLESRG